MWKRLTFKFKDTDTIPNAFIFSQPDYFNSLFAFLDQKPIEWLKTQNSATKPTVGLDGAILCISTQVV